MVLLNTALTPPHASPMDDAMVNPFSVHMYVVKAVMMYYNTLLSGSITLLHFLLLFYF